MGPFDDEGDGPARVELRNASGELLIGWDTTWFHSFMVWDDLVLVLTYAHHRPPGRGGDGAAPNGELIAYEMKPAGVVRWRQHLPTISVREFAGRYTATTRAELQGGSGGGVWLCMEVLGNEATRYAVTRETGELRALR